MSRALSIPPDAAARMMMLDNANAKPPGTRAEATQELVEPTAVPCDASRVDETDSTERS